MPVLRAHPNFWRRANKTVVELDFTTVSFYAFIAFPVYN